LADGDQHHDLQQEQQEEAGEDQPEAARGAPSLRAPAGASAGGARAAGAAPAVTGTQRPVQSVNWCHVPPASRREARARVHRPRVPLSCAPRRCTPQAVTLTSASRTICPSILEVPISRSTKSIGTSATRNPRSTARR